MGISRSMLAFASALILFALARPAYARPEYAQKEMKDCLYCHVRPGEERGFRGLYYAANKHSFEKFDENFEAKLAGVKAGSMGLDARPTVQAYPNNRKIIPALDFTVNDIDGKPVNLSKYQGDVLLVVNLASFDLGYTSQYAALQRLHERFKARGFQVLGFPCNDFGESEPGSDKKIKEFARSNYDITFPMFSKVTTVGPKPSPFYKYLTAKTTNRQFAGDLEGNFVKILINRKGEVVGRWRPNVDPGSERIVSEIERALALPREAAMANP